MKNGKTDPANAEGLVHCAKNQKIMKNAARTDMTDTSVVVTLCGEQPVVSSRRVAADFGKEHKSVLKHIAQLNREATAQNCAGLFIPWSYAEAAGRTDTIRKKDGTAKVVESLQWTPRGRRFLYDLLAENNLYPVLERAYHESAD